MKKSQFTGTQIDFALRQADEGTSVHEVCRKISISEATFYNWSKELGLIETTVNFQKPRP